MIAPEKFKTDDKAVSPVLGTVLMLALMVTLIPGLITLKSAISAEADAQADLAKAHQERIEEAAFCVRHPEFVDPPCDRFDYMRGYSCEPAAPVAGNPAVICVKKSTADDLPTQNPLTNETESSGASPLTDLSPDG